MARNKRYRESVTARFESTDSLGSQNKTKARKDYSKDFKVIGILGHLGQGREYKKPMGQRPFERSRKNPDKVPLIIFLLVVALLLTVLFVML